MNKYVIIAALVTFLAVIGLLVPPQLQAKDSEIVAEKKISIVTTTAMIGDAVRHVTGEKADVISLMGEGVDPHLYRPTRTDMVRLRNADIIIYNGLHLEGQMVELLGTLAEEKPAVAVARDLKDLLHDDSGVSTHDPHIWMDVVLWAGTLTVIEETLTTYAPESATLFSDNAKAYKEDLAALDSYIKEISATLNPEERILVTAHDAFGYFGRAYGFEVVGIQGLSTESEAGLRRIEELVTMLVERDIPAVFVESSVSDRNIRALVEGAAAQGHNVRIGGELFSDAMGAKGTYKGTYIGMLDHNATTMVSALGGKTPKGGLNGKLEQPLN